VIEERLELGLADGPAPAAAAAGPGVNKELQRTSILDGPRLFVVMVLAFVVVFPPLLLLMQSFGAEPGAAAAAADFGQHIERARVLLAAGRARESLVPIERARRLIPEAFPVHNNLCVAYGLLKRKAEAVAACQHALTIEPSNQLAKNNLAWVQGIAEETAQ
jgi:tetratricopeptide (TPR) repeat protein